MQTQTLDSSQQEQLVFTQSRNPNNKNKPAFKNIVSIVVEQIILSPPLSKNNEMMKIKEKLTLYKNLPKNHLYSTFVHPAMIEQKDTKHATEAGVHHELTTITKTLIHRIDIALHQETDSAMTKNYSSTIHSITI